MEQGTVSAGGGCVFCYRNYSRKNIIRGENRTGQALVF